MTQPSSHNHSNGVDPGIRDECRQRLVRMTYIEERDSIRSFLRSALERHSEKPFDAIIGDDVSGRIPTLLLHRFLRLGHTVGKVDTLPRTFFMASGLLLGGGGIKPLYTEYKWRRNISTQAIMLRRHYHLTNVLAVTEFRNSGDSLRRIVSGFSNGRPKTQATEIVSGGSLYLKGLYDGGATRRLVGVDKTPPEALSHRIIDFNGETSAGLRAYLNDYAATMYADIFGETPPEHISVTRDSYAQQ